MQWKVCGSSNKWASDAVQLPEDKYALQQQYIDSMQSQQKKEGMHNGLTAPSPWMYPVPTPEQTKWGPEGAQAKIGGGH